MDHDIAATELAERLADDLDGAFEALVRAHQDRLFSIALRALGDPRDAEEAAQDTFVRAYRALAGYDAERVRAIALRGWLATIVVNLCRNRVRTRHLETVPLEAGGRGELLAAATPPPHDGLARREAREQWARLLAMLPERYRMPVVLRHVDDLSYAEAAGVLGRPEGTVKAQVHRGLELLRAAHDADERAHADEDADTGERTQTGAAVPARLIAALQEVTT